MNQEAVESLSVTTNKVLIFPLVSGVSVPEWEQMNLLQLKELGLIGKLKPNTEF